MSKLTRDFAVLLSQAVRTIALAEHKRIQMVQDELGYALGKKGGSVIEYWRKGHAPVNAADVEVLTHELTRRGGLSSPAELHQFLASADYPQPQRLLEQLAPFLEQNHFTASKPLPLATQSSSPFIVGPPITTPRQFFGRQAEVEHLFTLWRRSPLQSAVITGLKQSGKTSLLHYLRQITQATPLELRPDQRHDWLPYPERYRWVYLDFHDVRTSNQEWLLRYLLTGLRLPAPATCDLHRFMDLVSEYLGSPAIILMDEIKVALTYPELDQRFWNSLRSLSANHTAGNLAFLLATSESLGRGTRRNNKTLPFFSIFGHAFPLQPLSEQAARQLIASSPLPFDPVEVLWILRQSRCWPCLLQALCHARLTALERGQTGQAWQAEGLRQIAPYRHLLEQEE